MPSSQAVQLHARLYYVARVQSDTGQSIFDEALSLPESDRAKLAQELLRSLEDDHEAPPALDDAALETELDRRLQQVVDGTVQTMTVEQAQAFLAERRAARRAR
ncbi:MAG: addiction module protein [Myxococcales bacterium]|nr:addiction module protein [Myxococcales bacterium]